MDEVIITKSRVNGKTFYYVQLLKDRQGESEDSGCPGEACFHNRIGCVWFTLQLGYVCDNRDRFITADALYTNSGGTLLTRVNRSELQRFSSRFCEAIEVAKQRYEATIRSSLLALLRWLDNHTGPAPTVSEKDTLVLQKLHEFREDLFGNRYVNSLYGRPRCDHEYGHCVCGAQ